MQPCNRNGEGKRGPSARCGRQTAEVLRVGTAHRRRGDRDARRPRAGGGPSFLRGAYHGGAVSGRGDHGRCNHVPPAGAKRGRRHSWRSWKTSSAARGLPMQLKRSSRKSSRPSVKVASTDLAFEDPVGTKVKLAFSGKQSKWRTVGGIAREAGLPQEKVQEYIRQKQQCFVTARVSPGGKRLYGVRLRSQESRGDSSAPRKELAAG